MHRLISKTDQDTRELGKKMGQILSGLQPKSKSISIALTGDLGTGKTTLVQGLARGLGVGKDVYVTSPSYSIINEYFAKGLKLCHLDLYRLGSADELDLLGFEELLDNRSVIAVEWPGLLSETAFEFDLEICLEYGDADQRIISLSGYGQTGLNLLSRLVL